MKATMVFGADNLMPAMYIRCTILGAPVGPLEKKNVVTITEHLSHLGFTTFGKPRLNCLQHGLLDG